MRYYHISHTTTFHYESPVRESVMEVRLHPRDEWHQSCLQFFLSVAPRTRVGSYRDWLNNTVHHFDIPGTHRREAITAESVVRLDDLWPVPESLSAESWQELAEESRDPAVWDMLQPSHFAHPTEELRRFMDDAGIRREADPLATAIEAKRKVCRHLSYVKAQTHADSPIDEALAHRAGVCQDFAHILIACCRSLGVPARYVSGYVYTGDRPERERQTADDATHAWVEVMMPTYGWMGLDPTHETVVGDRHIRAAVGRDYADVPPTRGVYRGQAESSLEVSVKVTQVEKEPARLVVSSVTGWTPPEQAEEMPEEPKPFEYFSQQMQQQQQRYVQR